MSGSSSPDSHSRKTPSEPDALGKPSSDATALGRTLEAELTRAATRANPTSLTPAGLRAAPGAPAAPAAPASPAAPAAPEADLDLISASSAASDDAATGEGDAPGGEDPDADGGADADDAQASSTFRRPRIGWGGVLALLNVVLSGFILMLWGVPRWDAARAGAATRANDGAPDAAGARTGAGAGGSANRIDPNRAGAASAAAARNGGRLTGAASMAGGVAGLNAAGPAGLTRRTTQSGAGAGVPGTASEPGYDGTGNSAGGAERVEVPELPQAIISVMPGQRAAEVTIPAATSTPAQPVASRNDNADAVGGGPVTGGPVGGGTVTTGADAAIEAGNTAATTRGNPGARVPIAGSDGVTMPERLAESHVRPTIAALADGEPVTGEVTLAATIRVDGSVADVQVLSSSRPGAGLEHAAADAVRRWRYKPATRDGHPVDSRLTITVTFR